MQLESVLKENRQLRLEKQIGPSISGIEIGGKATIIDVSSNLLEKIF
jgi:hypothetical protein